MQARDPLDVVRSVLEPGERIIWCGRPNVDAAMAGFPKRRGGLVTLAIFVLSMAVFVMQGDELGIPLTDLFGLVTTQAPALPFILGGMLLLPMALRALKWDNRSRYRRYFENLTYGVTDRRVLVIEKDDVQSFDGDQLDAPHVVERAAGYGDVIFARRRMSSGSGSTRNRDPVTLERRSVGFKAVPNAEELKGRLDEWIAGELQESAEAVSDFLEAQQDVDRSSFATPTGIATIRHPGTGLTREYPEEWSVQVRKKKKPFGKTFLDSEKWKALSESTDWTLVRIEGPSGCNVDAEVFESPMLATYDSMANSKLASLTGELVDSDPAYEQNGMQGFVVTRRSELQANQATGTVGSASVVTPFRYTILHDGTHQLCIMSKWPERSPQLTAAVDAVVRSARIE